MFLCHLETIYVSDWLFRWGKHFLYFFSFSHLPRGLTVVLKYLLTIEEIKGKNIQKNIINLIFFRHKSHISPFDIKLIASTIRMEINMFWHFWGWRVETSSSSKEPRSVLRVSQSILRLNGIFHNGEIGINWNAMWPLLQPVILFQLRSNSARI